LDPVTFVTFQEMLMPESSWQDSINAMPSQTWEQYKSCWPFFKKKNEYIITEKKAEL
jgi:hypothetical protein